MNANSYLLNTPDLAHKLRLNHTQAEKVLWAQLRNNQLGFKFRRQYPIDKYIVDFVCVKSNLIVEVDGGQHNAEIDKERDDYLKSCGFEILRFWNNDVLQNIDGICAVISNTLKISKF